jgi:CTP synthase
MKTKPSQHSVKELLSLGIQPDILVCRVDRDMTRDLREKLASFCNVEANCVVQNTTADSIYDVPLMLEGERFAELVCDKLGLERREPDLDEWRGLAERSKTPARRVKIALVGQYVEMRDAYLSVAEALTHAGIHQDTAVEISWLKDGLVRENAEALLAGADGIILPGIADEPFEGKIEAARYARERKIPLLALGSGMHAAVTEYARGALGHTEGADGASPIIDRIPLRRENNDAERPMRLGLHPCTLAEGSLAYGAYGADLIYERYRNNREVNIQYRGLLTGDGDLIVSGLSPDGNHIAVAELRADAHPWYVCAQFHPEYRSRLTKPAPLFYDFIQAASRSI